MFKRGFQMSMRQLCHQLDPFLNETFKNESLDSHEWFVVLEKIVEENMPRRYSTYETFQVVLQYVRWKAIQK